MPANKIKLEICGASYVIATTDTEVYVLSLAEKLDADMNQMMTNNPSASIATAAVITALGYLDELKKSTSGADNMRAQIKDYLEDAAKAKLSAEEARRAGVAQVVWCQTPAEAVGALHRLVQSGDALLAKASHAMALEELLQDYYAGLPQA